MDKGPRRIWVFFYGTFMNPDVLAEHGVKASGIVPAKVTGFELSIRPRVNLTPSVRSSAFGAIAAVTHDDLDRLYLDLEARFGLTYFPEAVLAESMDDGSLRPALCYTTPHMPGASADRSYVKQLAGCVRGLGLPEWYALHVESFGSGDGEAA